MISYRDESFEIHNATIELENHLKEEQRKSIYNVLLIGNGFDLALNKDTSFKSFTAFLVLFLVIYSIKNSQNYYPKGLYENVLKESVNHKTYGTIVQSVVSYLEDCDGKEQQLNTVLKEIEILFHNDFFSLVIKSMIPAIEFFLPYNFDNLRSDVSLKRIKYIYGGESFFDKYSQILPKIINNKPEDEYFSKLGRNDTKPGFNGYLDLLNKFLSVDYIAHWFDFESIIELVVTGDKYLKNKYRSPNYDYVFEHIDLKSDYVRTQNYLDGLNLFESLFSLYLGIIKKYDSSEEVLPDIKDLYLQSANEMSFGKILDLSFFDVDLVISYNYTDYAKSCFSQISKISNSHVEPYFCYINGKVSESAHLDFKEHNGIVIGYSSSESEKLSNIDLYGFEKKHRRILKNVKPFVFESYLVSSKKKYFNLLVFGHSCCFSDKDVLLKLFTSELLKNCVICCFSKREFRNIYFRVYSIINSKFPDNTDYYFNKIHFAIKKATL